MAAAMLPCYVMLDLETTGGSAAVDRITEIAAVRIEHGIEVDRWSTLVNPGVPIPPFIENLTGISDAMVDSAPRFKDVADRLLALLEGAVFVAHNVRFDHGFVLHELARMGRPFKINTLCTVRLSRKLYPQHKSHGLDALLQRHGLHTQARHRAMGDVDVVLQWLQIAQAELGAERIAQEAAALLRGSASLPPLLETPVADMPDTPGVYLFYGDAPAPLYIGKSVNLRSRVLAHFQSASKLVRDQRIAQAVRRVEWRETAGELGARLLEAHLVRQLKPTLNRKPRRASLADAAAEPMQAWPYSGRVAVREYQTRTDRTDLHVFDQWCHVATVHDAQDLQDAQRSHDAQPVDADIYRLLQKRFLMARGRDGNVFPLSP
jgi:DNA polymerase III subunit epsilon